MLMLKMLMLTSTQVEVFLYVLYIYPQLYRMVRLRTLLEKRIEKHRRRGKRGGDEVQDTHEEVEVDKVEQEQETRANKHKSHGVIRRYFHAIVPVIIRIIIS
jgi:hypothetical protein